VKPANPLIHGEVVVVVGQEAVFFFGLIITLALKTQRPTVGLGPLG
jgi:hypothetical protein